MAKLVASILLLIPASLLTALAVGEIVDGDVSGAQHLVEVIPLVLLTALGWRFPRVAGNVLLILGILVATAWVTLMIARREFAVLPFGLLLFAPAFIAGWLFRAAGRRASRE